MKNITIATVVAAGLSAAVLGLAAPAVAAPSGSGDAQQTVSQLEEQGNRVIVNRQSSAPLSQASVVDVRQGNAIQDYVWDAQGDRKVLETTGHVVFVDVR
ncbi:hypothetical protein [Mycolicibacterium sp. CR10]|uniref:hypothetical protein n=1 Tax=Mycolicibacterium sp. CR10 TaxID=2562314 RepID=UPI0010C02EF0|nr:hypothetical protein [Mycolicibacterium sp. CR10]